LLKTGDFVGCDRELIPIEDRIACAFDHESSWTLGFDGGISSHHLTCVRERVQLAYADESSDKKNIFPKQIKIQIPPVMLNLGVKGRYFVADAGRHTGTGFETTRFAFHNQR